MSSKLCGGTGAVFGMSITSLAHPSRGHGFNSDVLAKLQCRWLRHICLTKSLEFFCKPHTGNCATEVQTKPSTSAGPHTASLSKAGLEVSFLSEENGD
ncbi:hypothetical protein Y1Q_0004341 [Alligator mississippiensis]|uniref:Uncharacterized protein n=1 Tax=Alligator mississippiensis TaxID=8496 RepID=A0A151MIH8_ALLMI|nr:hypothetical protein Y1Q_0004341 [Alligator mississippiensis]